MMLDFPRALTDSTADRQWTIPVRVVAPDRPRPRRWRARLHAMGCPPSRRRLLADLAREDLIIGGERRRPIEDALLSWRRAALTRQAMDALSDWRR